MSIYKVGVVGAGTMGAGIAQVISTSGIPVVLKEVNEELLKKGLTTIRTMDEARVAKGRMTPQELEEKMKLVTPTTSFEAFKDLDLVIEAVPEILKIKLEIFRALDQACSSGAILASNTSALSISGLASATRRPEQVIGMHFFYPAHVMKLVEVIPGLETSPQTAGDHRLRRVFAQDPGHGEGVPRLLGQSAAHAVSERSGPVPSRRGPLGRRAGRRHRSHRCGDESAGLAHGPLYPDRCLRHGHLCGRGQSPLGRIRRSDAPGELMDPFDRDEALWEKIRPRLLRLHRGLPRRTGQAG